MRHDALWWGLLVPYVLLLLRWLWGHAELSAAVRENLLEPLPAAGSDAPLPRVSVIIAAHNEAETIGRCLEGVLAQGYPDLQVIVANDRSSDTTGQIVRRFAGHNPGLQCLDVTGLPPGWLGKTHALSVAAPRADGHYLLFTDSDVEWRPGALSAVIELAGRQGLDLVSLWPQVVLAGFWERLLLPACGWALSLWFPDRRPGRVGSTPAFANGQFLLIRRQAYERVGGHAAVRDELAEDVALARLCRLAGLRSRLGLGVRLIRTRMYAGLGQIIRGWTRIYIGALRARWKLAATILGLLVGCLAPFAILLLTGARIGGGGLTALGWAWLLAALAQLAAMYGLIHRLDALVFAGRARVALFPLAVLGVCGLLAWCLLVASGLGCVRWGDVRYRLRRSRLARAGPA